MSSQAKLLDSLINAVERGGRCGFCVVVTTRGSVPQVPGAMMLVHGDGRTEGTIGGGCVEAEVVKRGRAMLVTGLCAVESFDLDSDYGWDDGLICGGGMDIAILTGLTSNDLGPFRQALTEIRRQHEAVLPIRVQQQGKTSEYRLAIEATPTLLIAGGGHVGHALARLAVPLDFRVVVVDDRADLLRPDRLPPPIEGVNGDIADALRKWPIDSNTYVVVVTRGHQHDEEALYAIANSSARYIGMIGSRRKIRLIFDHLKELGIKPENLARIHSPIGIHIGSVTVPEIAVSIAAELIQVRRTQKSQSTGGGIKSEL